VPHAEPLTPRSRSPSSSGRVVGLLAEEVLEPAEVLLSRLDLVGGVQDLLAATHHPEQLAHLEDAVLAVLAGDGQAARQ
jgi:hypothetical protein